MAACPIRTSRHSYGVIVVHWTPPQPIARAAVDFMQQEADRLAKAFEGIGHEALVTPAVPTFITSDVQAVHDDAGPNHAPLRTLVKMAAERGSYLHQLQRLATELVMAVRMEDILAIARDRVVRPFGGTGFAVCLIEAGHVHVAGAAGLPRDVLRDLEGTPRTAQTPVTDAMNSARARIHDSTTALEHASAPGDSRRRTLGYFPFLESGNAVGCCVVEFAEPRKALPPPEVALLVLMLDKVSQSFARAKSVEAEHALARSIQHSLLPRSFPHIPEMVVTARYFSATRGVEIGGDWYDVVTLPDARIGLVIGDVEGHNLEAAAVMGQLRSAVRAYAAEGHEPAAILERSNELLMGLDTDLHATCCCVLLDTATGLATAASAGHPGPMVSHGPTGVVLPELPSDPPLGVFARTTYHQASFRLPPGSVAALFTDGLLGARRAQEDAALDRLARALEAASTEDLEVVADRIIGDCGGGPGFDDDAALILVRYEGAAPSDTAEVARMFVDRDDLRGVAGVRAFLRDLLEQWDVAPESDEMQVLASEVVTNALIHAHSRVDLRLRKYSDRIRVEVQDSDPSPPVPTTLLEDDAENEEAENGRGLLIVEALANAWGSSPAGRGKITWFEL
jgi:anti-sigma regulatory factor (Ser/Thr protein kinase)